MKTTLMTQNEMQMYKEYATLNSKGVLFILMRDKDNNLHSLTHIDETSHHHHYKRIKNLTTARKMYEPTKEDYNLFLKCVDKR